MSVPWKKLLPRLWHKQNGLCFFCQAQTMLWREARSVPGARLTKSGRRIIIGDQMIALATVEHLVRRSEGGAKKGSNCVMACASCNWKRDRKDQQKKAKEAKSQQASEEPS
jgi:hypothetical protein